jgi:hypothetical protein
MIASRNCSSIRAPKADADIAKVLTMDESNIAKLSTLLSTPKVDVVESVGAQA